MIKDLDFNNMQLFAPNGSATYSGTVIPSINAVVMPKTDVGITIDGIEIVYKADIVIGLQKGVSYTLSASTDFHVMV